MDKLYEEMKALLQKVYATNQGGVMIDIRLFFRLYKLVCDMMQVENIVKNQ